MIIPVYNEEKYLAQCLDSILAQTLRDFELICVDDGSTDGSFGILKAYEQKDPRVKVMSQQNAGSAAARNNALEISQGDYVTFLDSDDFYAPELLEAHYSQLEKTGADVCACLGEFYHDDTNTYSPWRCLTKHLTPKKEVFRARDLGRYAFRFTFSGPTNKMIRRSFILEHRLRYQQVRMVNDLYFICMCVALAKKVTVTADKTLAYYRVGLKTNLQSSAPRSPLDCVKAGTALKEGLKREGLYPLMKKGYDNFMGFEIERYAVKLSAFPDAFAQLVNWYRETGHAVYDIALSSLDPGTLSNLLMTFEGVCADTPAEEARRKVIENKQKYAALYEGHKARRMRFLIGRLAKMEGWPKAIARTIGYLFEEVRLKMVNR